MLENKIHYFKEIYEFYSRSYIYCFIRQTCFFKNKKFNFPAKIYEIKKKC